MQTSADAKKDLGSTAGAVPFDPVLPSAPATRAINASNVEVSVPGDGVVGFVLHYTLGKAPGWYFVAAHKRFTNRYPDSMAPVATWQEAVPT